MIITVTTRGCNRNAHRIVGVTGRSPVGSQSGYRYIIRISSRISGHSCIFITCGKYNDTSVYDIVWRTGIMKKIIEGFFFQRSSIDPIFIRSKPRGIPTNRIGKPRIISPTTLQNNGTVICCIFHSFRFLIQVTSFRTGKDLTTHDFYTTSIIGFIPSCNATNTFTIIPHCTDNPGHMSPMSSIIRVVIRDIAFIICEVVAIAVTGITISISIFL